MYKLYFSKFLCLEFIRIKYFYVGTIREIKNPQTDLIITVGHQTLTNYETILTGENQNRSAVLTNRKNISWDKNALLSPKHILSEKQSAGRVRTGFKQK